MLRVCILCVLNRLASFCRETRFYSEKSAFCKGIQSFEGVELAALGGKEIICM